MADNFKPTGDVRSTHIEVREHHIESKARKVLVTDSTGSYALDVTTGGAILTSEGARELKRRFDNDGRSDFQAVYIGWAERGTAEDATGWIIEKYAYDSTGFCTSVDIGYGKWSERDSVVVYD